MQSTMQVLGKGAAVAGGVDWSWWKPEWEARTRPLGATGEREEKGLLMVLPQEAGTIECRPKDCSSTASSQVFPPQDSTSTASSTTLSP